MAQIIDARTFFLELHPLASGERPLARNLDGQRVDEARIDQHLVMKMRAGDDAGCADIADNFSLPHLHSGRDAFAEAEHVGVGGVVAVGMSDADVVAVLAFAPSLLDHARACREDRRARRRRPVDAGVHAPLVEQRRKGKPGLPATLEKPGLARLCDHSVALIVKSRVRALLMLRGKSKDEADEFVERFSGHSLRAGYVTSGAGLNMPTYRLQQHTRHKSPAMIGVYVREADKWNKNGLDGLGF